MIRRQRRSSCISHSLIIPKLLSSVSVTSGIVFPVDANDEKFREYLFIPLGGVGGARFIKNNNICRRHVELWRMFLFTGSNYEDYVRSPGRSRRGGCCCEPVFVVMQNIKEQSRTFPITDIDSD